MDSDKGIFMNRNYRRCIGAQMSDPVEDCEQDELINNELFNAVFEEHEKVEELFDSECLSEDEWVDEEDIEYNLDVFQNDVLAPDKGGRKKRKSHPPTSTFQERLQVKKLKQSKRLPKGKRYRVVYKCKDNSTPSTSRGPQAAHTASKRTLKNLLERVQKLRLHTPKEPITTKKLTQEELLEEAKITEIENLKSLERYKHVEIEKKSQRIQDHQQSGPTITFRSRAIPLIEEVNPSDDDLTNVVNEESVVSIETETPTPGTSSQKNQQEEKCERTLITFTDENFLRNIFTPKRPTTVKKKIVCPISGEQCKYFDPLTKIPYGNVAAFRILREDYHQQVERNGYYAGPQVPQWIEFFQNQEHENIETETIDSWLDSVD